MLVNHKRVLLGIVTVLLVMASGILAIEIVGHIQRGYAQSPTVVSTVDFYTPRSWAPWGTAFDKSGRVWVAIPGCDPSPTCSKTTPPGILAVYNPGSTGRPAVYQLPAGFGQALFLAFDKQGRVWFPMPMSNSLGMFDPAAHSFSQWPVPTPDSGPWAVAVDSKGKIWLTEHYTNKIASFNPVTHIFKEIATPALNSLPYGITVDATDNIWFTENNSAVALIGEYTAQGVLKEYKIRNGSTNGLTPHLIAVAPTGSIWWTEGWVGMIGKLDVSKAQPGTNNGVTEYAYAHPCARCGTHTSGIAVGKDGTVWFDDSLQSIFGSFDGKGTGSFSLYTTPTQNSHPHDGLNIDNQNMLWFDEEFANKLAQVTLSTTIVSPPTATPSSHGDNKSGIWWWRWRSSQKSDK